MKLNYKIERNDFLQHQLFIATTSPRIKKQNRKEWLRLTFISFTLSGLFYYVGQGWRRTVFAFYFSIVGIILLFFYPSMQKKSRLKNLGLVLDDIYKFRYGQEVQIQFTNDNIETTDITGESKLRIKCIQQITEIADYFYIKMLTSDTLIIPKTGVMDIVALRELLKNICAEQKVEYISNLTLRPQ